MITKRPTKIQKVQHTLTHVRYERIFLWCEWVVLFAAVGLYGYSIVSSIINVVLRQEIVVALQETDARISELESEYLEKTATLTSGMADDVGLVAVAPSAYVSIADKTRLLSHRP